MIKRKKKEEPKRNVYLDVQIQNQIMEVENFMKLCEHAAKKDDGQIDESETRILKALDKDAKRFIKSMKRLMQ